MTIQRESGVALWRQIAASIEADIRAGRLRAGDRLPTEHVYAEQLGVNRHTVRRAVEILARDGWVKAERGRGTFVQDNVLDYKVGRRTRFSESLDRGPRESTRKLKAVRRLRAGTAIASALGLKANDRIEQVELVGFADEHPISYAKHSFCVKRFRGIGKVFEELGTISGALAQLGIIDYRRGSTRVISRLCKDEEQMFLKITAGRPVLVTESVNIDLSGNPVEYGYTVFPADRVQLVLDSSL